MAGSSSDSSIVRFLSKRSSVPDSMVVLAGALFEPDWDVWGPWGAAVLFVLDVFAFFAGLSYCLSSVCILFVIFR